MDYTIGELLLSLCNGGGVVVSSGVTYMGRGLGQVMLSGIIHECCHH